MPLSEVSLEPLADRAGVLCMLALDHRAAQCVPPRRRPGRERRDDARAEGDRRGRARRARLRHPARPRCGGLPSPGRGPARPARGTGSRAAEDLAESGADLLKLQFPSDKACARLADASAPLPWALLGGSEVDGETFARQLETACRAGVCGFIAGRAIWGGALGLAEPEEWLARVALPLFERLSEIAHDHASNIR